MNRRIVGRAKEILPAVGVTLLAGILTVPSLRAQPATPAPKPQFEIASLKPGANCTSAPGRVEITAGRLRLTCQTVMALVQRAYVVYSGARYNSNFHAVHVEGGPSWINSESDRFDLDAKSEAAAAREVLQGPMLQSFLEDRLKLKLHRETRDIPIYELNVAKGGLKMERIEEGSCVPANSAPPPPGAARKPACGQGSLPKSGPNGEIQEINLNAISMEEFLDLLPRFLDRTLIDKTGLSGRFNLRLQFTRDLSASDSSAPSIFTAMQEQLGLKLEPAKGPGEFLIIDNIERPAQN